MTISINSLVENFPSLFTLVRAPKEVQISGLRAAANAEKSSLIFVSNRQHLREARESAALAWVVHKDLVNEVPASIPTLLTSPNTQLAMAFAAKKFFPQTQHFQPINGPKIHPTAQIAKSAKVGEGCIIGPGAVISEEVVIGSECIIGSNSVIEAGAKIGDKTHIHPLVYIGHHCEIGNECEIQPNSTIGTEGFGYAQDQMYNHHRITHYGRVIIEDRVHIGSGVNIDRGTYLDSRIGRETKIDNHCHFGHNIQIGNNTLITGGMITAGSVTIGSYCVFGGRTTIAGHLSICDKVQVGGMSGIQKSITKPGEYGGFPLQDLKSSLKTRVAIRNLPKLQSSVKKMMRHLGLKEDSAADAAEL
jgi:UDP-3-O-[3-hydroxymyristoyl] glucosamine N-acyltransferase